MDWDIPRLALCTPSGKAELSCWKSNYGNCFFPHEYIALFFNYLITTLFCLSLSLPAPMDFTI
jgi:hypothetical protein